MRLGVLALAAIMLVPSAIAGPVAGPMGGGAPDVAVSDLRYRPVHRGNETAVGDVVGFEWTMANLGDAPAANFTWRLEIDGRAIVEGPWNLTLRPGERFPASWGYWTAGPVGPHRLRLVVDPEGLLPQARRDNDAAEALIDITSTTRPQLRHLAMGVDPPRPRPGEAITPWILVENNGTAPAVDFAVRFDIGEGYRALVVVNESISPGGTRNITAPPWTAQPGVPGYEVHIDALDQLIEHSESGKQVSTSILVQDPDAKPNLRVTDLRLEGAARDGERAVFRALVANHGRGAARGTTLILEVDGREVWRQDPLGIFPAGHVLDEGGITWDASGVGRHTAVLRVIAGEDAEADSSDDAVALEFEVVPGLRTVAVGAAAGGGAAAGLLMLYHRIHPRDVLRSPARARIVEVVRSDPGCTVGTIARRLGLSYKTAARHVRTLRRARVLQVMEGPQSRLFVAGELPPTAVHSAVVLRTPAARRLLDRLRKGPARSQRVAREIGVAPSTVTREARRLEEAGLVGRARDGTLQAKDDGEER